jgi:hypothetical protein
MWRSLILHLVGWLPLWVLAVALRQTIRPGRILFGAALVGFVGGMCTVELRRYGLLAAPGSAISLPIHDLHLDEVIQFAILGAAGALASEIFLDRARRSGAKEGGRS